MVASRYIFREVDVDHDKMAEGKTMVRGKHVDLIVIPKSVTPSRIIDDLNKDQRTGPDPDVVYEKI